MYAVKATRSPHEEAHNRHARGPNHAHVSPPSSPPLKTGNMTHYALPSPASRIGPSDRVKKALEFSTSQHRKLSNDSTNEGQQEEVKPAGQDATATERPTLAGIGSHHISSSSRRPSLPAMFNRLTSEPSSPQALTSASTKNMTNTPSYTDTDAFHATSVTEDNPLTQLVYTSSSKDRFMSRSELETILTSSRKTNARNEITGLLLYRDGSFAQFLEGPRTAVLDTFDRIQHDSRHRGVIVVLQRPVDKRDFGEWRMGFRDLDVEIEKGGNDNEDRGDIGDCSVGQEGKDAVVDLARANLNDLSHAQMSKAIRTLVKVFHSSLARPI